MILADSSVWIDFLVDRSTPQTERLTAAVIEKKIVMGDLTLAEILQGIRSDQRFAVVRDRLQLLPTIAITDARVAVQAAANYRLLRAKGITIRKTIDTLIATRCIIENWSLLYSDRDFDPFVTHLGLRPALA